MRRIKRNNRLGGLAIAVLTCLMSFADAMAQKQFTLEDLNFGGKNYHNMTPENRYATWWGETLVRLDAENCSTIDTKTGKENVLFNLEEINKWAETTEEAPVRSLYYAEFPYPGKPYVLVKSKKERILVDFKKHNTVWRQDCENASAKDWNAKSKALAFVKDNQLYVTDGNGVTNKLTDDGSREIVYGQAVHRNEFGIMKGTFWSNNGEKLAFYRMD